MVMGTRARYAGLGTQAGVRMGGYAGAGTRGWVRGAGCAGVSTQGWVHGVGYAGLLLLSPSTSTCIKTPAHTIVEVQSASHATQKAKGQCPPYTVHYVTI